MSKAGLLSKRKMHFLISLLLLIILVINCPLAAKAEARMGEIEIDYDGRDKDDELVHISGAKFIIFPIQYAENGKFIWRDEFAGCGVSLDDDSDSAREEQAKQLYEYALKHHLSGIEHVTDSRGEVFYLDLAQGMYLIAQEEKVHEGNEYFMSEPFLISIPSEIDGKLEYDIIVEPKAEWTSFDDYPDETETETAVETETSGETESTDVPEETEETKQTESTEVPSNKPGTNKPSKGVKTGDDANVIVWLVIAVISFGYILIIYKKRRNNN